MIENRIRLDVFQHRSALCDLRDYSYWMFFSERGLETLAKKKTKYKDREFSLSLSKDGIKGYLCDTSNACVFDCSVYFDQSASRFGYRAEIKNIEKDLPADAKYFDEIQIFALSLFQRYVAGNFLANMQEETINSFADDLSRY